MTTPATRGTSTRLINGEAPLGAPPTALPELNTPVHKDWKHRHVLDLDDFEVDEIELCSRPRLR